MFARSLTIALLLAGCAATVQDEPDTRAQQAAWTAQCRDDSGWDDPGPPFKVHGDSYYVGTCGIAAILIAGDQGHILIDTGTAKGGELVAANIRALGFDPADVEVLLLSHEHYDHAGGTAWMKQLTGARLLVAAGAAGAISSGRASAEDPQLEIDEGMAAASVDGAVQSGTPVTLGNLSLSPIETPGHTPGATSWQWRSCEGDDCRTIVYADSLTPVSSDSYRFTDHPAYVATFRASLERLAQLDCDVILTPHPSASAMRDRLISGALGDGTGCRAYSEDRGTLLDERLKRESNG